MEREILTHSGEKIPAAVGPFSPSFILFGALLTCASVAGVLLVKNAGSRYDASGTCLLDGQYTEVTRTRGSSRNVSYRIGYSFVAGGVRYAGTDNVYQRPASRYATVFYMAGNPQDNALSPNRLSGQTLVFAGIAFLIAIIAYWRLPTDYFTEGSALRAVRLAVGDSGGEHLTMPHGTYDAWFFVGIAFLTQTALAATLLALLLARVGEVKATSDAVLVFATVGAVGQRSGSTRTVGAASRPTQVDSVPESPTSPFSMSQFWPSYTQTTAPSCDCRGAERPAAGFRMQT